MKHFDFDCTEKNSVQSNKKNNSVNIRLIRCVALILMLCIFLTGCDMSLYKEVLKDKKYIPGKKQTVASESTVESTIEKEVGSWVDVEVPADGANNSNTGDSDQDNEDSYFGEVDEFDREAYKNKVNDLYFGYFGSYYGGYFDDGWGERYYMSDHFNCSFEGVGALPMAKKYNNKTWLMIANIYHSVIDSLSTGSTGWQGDFDRLNQSVIDTGAEEALLGWYLDEPDNMQAVKILSDYARKYGRRFFVCFTVNAVSPRSYGGFQGENKHTSRDTTQYLTDVAFDCYWDVESNMQMFKNIIEDMHNTCPEDAYVWYVPGTYDSYSIKDRTRKQILASAQSRIKQLPYYYGFLMAEKKPGGILCFSGNFDSPSEQLYGIKQIMQVTNGGWQALVDELEVMGRKICTMKID
ncbi:MAG: hypothetical protein IKK24_00770 [Clostridia bacterium]|nr:hypothetical protein [Clostridia bacterium]